MSAFGEVTLEQFKRAVADFTKAAEVGDLTEEQLDNGMKAVNLFYLGLPVDPLTLLLAKGYLEFAAKRYFFAQTASGSAEREPT